jgi:hypothetical protein
LSHRIENWPPGLDRPALWVRFRLFEDWSVWHRPSRLPEHLSAAGVRFTDCWIPLSPGAALEERTWPGIPDELCCEVCLRRYLIAKVPPLGSPAGEPTSRRGGVVIRTSPRRGRSNQPSL